MKKLKGIYGITLALLLFSFTTSAQKFTTHVVKQGETILSIARKYRISPISIVNSNKEITDPSELSTNTILVIPLDSQDTLEQNVVVKKSENTPDRPITVTQEEPLRFFSYKVKKKDNLFRLAQQFGISQDQIKKYNKELYSVTIRKGMTLKIPKYRRIETEQNPFNPDAFETYTVQPKETRWSILNKYGITMDSLIVLNPDLSKENNYLAAGQNLRVPKLAGSTTENQTTQLYVSYTVPSKMGYMSLEREFGVSETELKALNPELNQRGLQEGMVIRIPQKKASTAAVNADNFIFYEVKQGDAEYGLTRKLGLSYRELLALNPELQTGLKAGMVLKLPKDSDGNFEVKNSLIIENIDLVRFINKNYKPNLVMMLPFRLDIIDVNDKEGATNSIEKRKDANYSLGLYSGALVALDSIKKLGVSVNISVYDTKKSIEHTKDLLLKPEFKNASVIIGPLDSTSLQEVALQLATYQVPIVAPIPVKHDASLSNVFYSVPSEDDLRKHILTFVKEKKTSENVVVIVDEAHTENKKSILEQFPNAKSLELVEKYAMKDKILALLSETEENWVFLEADQFNTINSVVSVLNASITDKIKIKLFTTNKGKAYEDDKLNHTHLSNLAFTYPSVEGPDKNDPFEASYKKLNKGKSPDKYARRGFDLTFDILLKLAYKNNLFEASKFIGETKYSGNKFNYTYKPSKGYFNSACYIMTYDHMWIKEAK